MNLVILSCSQNYISAFAVGKNSIDIDRNDDESKISCI